MGGFKGSQRGPSGRRGLVIASQAFDLGYNMSAPWAGKAVLTDWASLSQ